MSESVIEHLLDRVFGPEDNQEIKVTLSHASVKAKLVLLNANFL